MAVTVERLIATLEARFDKYEKSLNRARGHTDRQFRAIEMRGRRMESRMATIGGNIGRRFVAALAAGISVRGLQALSDAATRIDNALKVAGVSGDELEKVYARLRQSALDNAAPVESLVELYGKAALVQKELGVSTEELLSFTDRIAVALRVSGQSASASGGALLQLSQALGSGVVRAEEFNSILEGALPIAQATAAGLAEAGGSVSKLRQLVIDGKVSSEAFFRAFEAGSSTLDDKVSGSVFTISQRFENLQTALVDAAWRFNESSGAANTFGEAIDGVTDFVNSVDFNTLIAQIGAVIDQFRAGVQWANNFAASIAEATGLENVGEFLTGGDVQKSFLGGGLTITSAKALRDRIESAHAGPAQVNADIERLLRERYGGAGKAPRLSKPKFTPVSLSDFDLPDGKSGSGKKERLNDLEREIRQIRERTDAVRAETQALASLNPIIDDYGYALEKARATQELLTAASRAGVKVTPELRAQIAELSVVGKPGGRS